MRTYFLQGLGLLFLGLSLTPTVRALSWTPGWTSQPAASVRSVSTEERDRARQLGDGIDSLQTAGTAIHAWEAIATANPNDTEAWTQIGVLYLLEGAAYRERVHERLGCYRASLQACERAMATNPDFLHRVQTGQTMAEASKVLGAREMTAMQFWTTGIFYIFRDCLGTIGRITNVRLLNRAKTMLEQMDAVEPDWGEGESTFTWGIYYFAMPKSRGGDRVKARAYFDRAVALGQHYLLPRWGRGKYFYTGMGETAAAREDFSAVVSQKLDGVRGNRSWNRYFQAEAARFLAK